ncbi:MAG TPA: T9SS type A sorting domain-containing protein, partial [candidate division Zixibacteria bacterium]|nr:T9SS type A sorting domain-containing protein [candidate division Zixibacteria bacterium]
YKVIYFSDPLPERPFFDSTWSTFFDMDTISYNPTLDRLVLSVDYYTPVNVPECGLPEQITVSAYPNPFNSAVMIEIESGEWRVESIEVFDLAGRCIDVIDNSGRSDTIREFIWTPPPSLPSGVYLVRASFDGGSSANLKLTYIK